jgi:hypothetical protein
VLRRSAVAALAALSFAAAAAAITNGAPDNGAHPAVGALVFAGAPQCSGTLIAPGVFLTAGHCTAGLPSNRVDVTFSERLDPATWTLRSGTAYTDPLFGHDRGDLHDLAVVVLDQPVSGTDPATLPAAGSLGAVDSSQAFTNVGYGFSDRRTGGGNPTWVYDGLRRVSTSPYGSLTRSLLKLPGGVCFGDSGGPRFLGSSTTVAAVTSGGDMTCSGMNWSTRLDTPGSRSFLSEFVAVP